MLPKMESRRVRLQHPSPPGRPSRINSSPTTSKEIIANSVMGYFKIWAQSRLVIPTHQYRANSHGYKQPRELPAARSQVNSHTPMPLKYTEESYSEHLIGDNLETSSYDDDDDLSVALQGLTFGARTISNDDDTDLPVKRLKLDNQTPRLLACPYLKHDREKYQTWRSCMGPGWATVHRVKEHLYRKHLLPKNRCNRCDQPFGSIAQLMDHQRSDVLCPIMPQSHDGINEDQLQMLRSRKRTDGKGPLSEEQKWVKMYSIIFPDDASIPSPYHDPSVVVPEKETPLAEHGRKVLKELSDHALSEVPKLLDSIFAERTNESLNKTQIAELTQDIIQHVIRDFQPTTTPTLAKEQPMPQEPSKLGESSSLHPASLNDLGFDTTSNQDDAPDFNLVDISSGFQLMETSFDNDATGAQGDDDFEAFWNDIIVVPQVDDQGSLYQAEQ
ncbi:hypothetical protein GGR54DRAFT_608422 [Hypoxylon sp. NC1633]|nr:hypothetical protein GGR54DRAFT_608422 [Hypoxylon sp. NC1633]